MKIPNIHKSDFFYSLFPKVALINTACDFEIKGNGIDKELVAGKEYCVRAIGQEENNSSELLTYSTWQKYGGVTAVADADGVLRFTLTLSREQIYTLRLAEKDSEGEWSILHNFRVFCAKPDLYERIPVRGNTHCHTSHSVDGHEDPFIAASLYRKAGFDYLAITDHHLTDGSLFAIAENERLPSDMWLLAGEEVHVPDAYIHAVNVGALFDGEGLDKYYHSHKEECEKQIKAIAGDLAKTLPENVLPMDFAYRKWIADMIHSAGGIAILAHPFWEWEAHNTRDDMFRFLAKEGLYDAAEILHGQEKGCQDANMQTAFWNDMRAEGIDIAPVGVDDAHRRYFNWDYECGFNEVYTVAFVREKTLSGLKEAFAGRYSAAVESYEDAPEHVVGTYRLTKFTLFLLENYFPFHDELCFIEGHFLKEAYLGDENALRMLSLLKGQTAEYYGKFFGKGVKNGNR